MKKLLLILPLLAFILACQAITGRPTTTFQKSSGEPKGITIVRLHKQGGDLSTQLAAEAQKAAALGQQPVVYFDATW
jgi:hypothetical protein